MKRRILLKPNVDGAKAYAGRAEGGFQRDGIYYAWAECETGTVE